MNWGCLFQNSKTLRNGKYHQRGSHGQTRYVSGNICKSRWIWLMGYVENLNWRWYTVYLQGVLGRYFCTWSTHIISGTRKSVNEWPSWSNMANITNYHTFNYGTHMGFWKIHTFCINMHDWSYITCYTNETLCESGRWNIYAKQTGNG